MARTRIFKREASSTDGSRYFSGTAWVVERDIPGEPGAVTFSRWRSEHDAYADAAGELDDSGRRGPWELPVAKTNRPAAWRL